MTNSPENLTAASDHVMGALIGAGLEVEGVQDKLAADPAAIDALNYVQVTLGDALDYITERTEHPEKVDPMTSPNINPAAADPGKVNTMTELTEVTPADAAAIAEVDAEMRAESEAEELDDLAGDVYIALSDAEDELGKLATRIELFGSHPAEPSTYDLDRHLAAARAALEALAASLPADGVHKPYPAGHPLARP